ncbi:Phage capsid family protein [Pseudooceanicola marinus]|uniref:Phage capsid family protein n=2 Tax=Pseudooceanicola marinus TaxID=396013 RepID=A0A1X7A4I7_9RHOB|nr:phage major capsid protein [Pseudooceanicola marinus]PJE27147.1 phage major capsid protein [Pseudooceanicola marinus]SLN70322.1 Phage capsid family protein [Pseudooceanicola marinus]
MTQKIAELRQKAMKVHGEAQGYLEEADRDGTSPERAAELRSQFDTAMDDFDRFKAEADRLERLAETEEAAAEMRERLDRGERESRRATGAGERFDPGADGRDEYREHFRAALAAGFDLSAVEPETRAAMQARQVRAENRAATGASGPAGGYTVPSTVADFIVKALAIWGPMTDATWVMDYNTASGGAVLIPGVDDTGNPADAHTEGDAAGTGPDAVLSKTDLSAFTVTSAWLPWSFELAQDSSFAWEQILGELIGERLARRANVWLTTGTGSGQPLGLVTAAQVGLTTASSSAITSDNILEIEAEVDPAYRRGPKCGYMMHDKTRLAVRKLKNANGDYMWREGDLTKGVPPTLNGYTVRLNQDMEKIGAGKKVMTFGDHGKYVSRRVGAPLLGIAREKFFPNLGIAGVHRIDGALSDLRAVKSLQMAA